MKNTSAYAVLTRFGIIAAVLATLVFIASAASAATNSVDYDENGTEPVARFTATDPEGNDITWKVEGAKGVDNDDFEISESGVLTFKKSPNFESPTDRDEKPDEAGDQGVGDNIYKVSITANGGSALVLTVNVKDVDEAGSVKIDQPQPQVSRSLKAIGFDDPDSGVENQVISWERGASADGADWTDLKITTASYTPKAADVGNYLRVTYTYDDKFGDGKTVSAVSENPVETKTLANAAPAFPKEDDAETADEGGDANTDKQDGSATNPYVRKVAEEKASGTTIGDPLAATDADNDVLLYSLSNITGSTDKDCFSIDARSGQLKVAKKVSFESPTTQCSGDNARDGGNVYQVNVTATDPSSASKTVLVRIIVTDVNETPEFNSASKELTTVWIVEGATNTEVFKAEASAKLEADPATQPPDTDSGDDADYTASDDDNADNTSEDTITYSLEGGDAAKFSIASAANDGTLTKLANTVPDFEDKSSYSIVVVAKSARGTGDDEVAKYDKVSVTVKVFDVDDPGEVTLTQREPQVGASVTASVTDPDGDVTNVGWQWYRLTESDATTVAGGTAFVPTGDCPASTADDPIGSDSCIIDGATSASYTPTSNDAGSTTAGVRYLMARTTYNDKFNEGSTKDDAQGSFECCGAGGRSCKHGSGVRRPGQERSWGPDRVGDARGGREHGRGHEGRTGRLHGHRCRRRPADVHA